MSDSKQDPQNASQSQAANTIEYNQAIEDLNKAKKQAYIILIVGVIILVTLFASVFYWLGTQAQTKDREAEVALATEQLNAARKFESQIILLTQERDQLHQDIENLQKGLAAAEAKYDELEESLRATVTQNEASKKQAVDSELENLLQNLLQEATQAKDLELDRYKNLQAEAAQKGLSEDSLPGLEQDALNETEGSREQLTSITAFRLKLAENTAVLEKLIEAAETSILGTTPPTRGSATTDTTNPDATPLDTRNPEEIFAFLSTPEARSWAYKKDLTEFAQNDLTYEFSTTFDGRRLNVPFYSYDRWKIRLEELQNEGVPIPLSLFSFPNYELFARSIPYFQSIGVYVGPKITFEAYQKDSSE